METISVIQEIPKNSTSLFKRNQELFQHIIIACDNPLKYKCTICNKSFKSKSNCSYHKNCANNSLKQYKCSICPRRFSAKSHYEYHMYSHKGLSPFNCSRCPKSFKTKNKLLRHEEIHAEKRKVHPCLKCQKTFFSKTSLKNHERSHTGEKPFQCFHCSKAFFEKKNLINHINSHNKIKNYICEICGNSFVVKWNLELHRRTHFPSRSFKCSEGKCSVSFLQKRYLMRHMELHKNITKYECQICNQEFSRKDNLRRHSLKHLEEQSINNKLDTKEERCKLNKSQGVSITLMSQSKENYKEKQILGNNKNIDIEVENVENIHELLNKNSTLPYRESVIKTVPITNINNRISVIKDGRKEMEKICPCAPKEFIQIISQPIVINSNNDENNMISKSPFNQEKPNSGVFFNQSQNIHNLIIPIRTSAIKHCPIPKKMITACYTQGLHYETVTNNNSSNKNNFCGLAPKLDQFDTFNTHLKNYDNLLDLSMKNHE